MKISSSVCIAWLVSASSVVVEGFVPAASFVSTKTTTTTTSATTQLFSATKNKNDYFSTIESMNNVLEDLRDELEHLKVLARHMSDLEASDPSLTDLGDGEEANRLRLAVREAKAAVDTFGAASSEARQAWQFVDDVSAHLSTGSDTHFRYSAKALEAHHAYNAVVDTKLLQDSVQAVENLKTLAHFVQVERKRLLEKNNAFQ